MDEDRTKKFEKNSSPTLLNDSSNSQIIRMSPPKDDNIVTKEINEIDQVF
jgi:hypothetical protein